MSIDKSTFLILVGTIAASGAGGWFARDRLMLRSEALAPKPTPEPTASQPAPPEPKSAEPVAPPAPAVPSCDDSTGEIPQCPAFPDPGDEGGCGQMAAARCAQYRESLEPKVARAAVECLKRLRGAELCDPIALNKCGHEALMAACPAENLTDAAAPAGGIDESCKAILTACKDSVPGPTLADCKQTLSGLNDTGRRKMLACTQKQCRTRGLYGCEAR
jgi:hypothetical protein